MSQIENLGYRYHSSGIGDGLGYTALLPDNVSDADPGDTSKSGLWSHGKKSPIWFWATRVLSGFFLLCVLVLAALGLVCASKSTQESLKSDVYSCGHSPSEARAKGCHFEPMMSAWIPDQCSHSDLVDEYEDIFATWKWYSDDNLTAAITGAGQLDELRAGNYSGVWTSRKHAHDLHCLYAWRKISITLGRNLSLLDARSFDFHHSTHCAKGISALLNDKDPMEGKLYATAWPMMYHACVPILRS